MIKSTLCVLNKDFQGDICLLAMPVCKQGSAISRIVSCARGWEEPGPSSKTFTPKGTSWKKIASEELVSVLSVRGHTLFVTPQNYRYMHLWALETWQWQLKVEHSGKKKKRGWRKKLLLCVTEQVKEKLPTTTDDNARRLSRNRKQNGGGGTEAAVGWQHFYPKLPPFGLTIKLSPNHTW